MMLDLDNPSLKFPCANCMGFCVENTKCVRCSICINWFHKSCCKLSNIAFDNLRNNTNLLFIENSDYICKFCSNLQPCDICRLQITPLNIKSSLYCITCKIRVCDDCNTSFSSDQLKIFKETDTPFYCRTCSDFYPCKVCKTHCYDDIVHAPSIFCNNCKYWLHHACSKLSHTQFNRLGNESIDYVCHVCVAENIPFIKLCNYCKISY